MSDISKLPINSKADRDRDRVRQRAVSNRQMVEAVRRVLKDYEQGRAASACMDKIKRKLARKGGSR